MWHNYVVVFSLTLRGAVQAGTEIPGGGGKRETIYI